MDVSTKGFAIVTGAGSGIGLETATAFAQNGAAGVMFTDINTATAENAASKSKAVAKHSEYRAEHFYVNTADLSSVQAMIKKTQESFGRIDYAVNCAGVGNDKYELLHNIPPDVFDRIVTVNLYGSMHLLQSVLPVMQAQEAIPNAGRTGQRGTSRGTIALMSSALGQIAIPNTAAYTAAKHGIMGLTKSAALESGKYGIRVNAICPTWVDTPLMHEDQKIIPDMPQTIERMVPLQGRIALSEEVADLIMFLCGPAGSYISGIGVMLDGAATATAAT